MTTTDSPEYAFDISIVIVSFNTRNVLRECLEVVRKVEIRETLASAELSTSDEEDQLHTAN